MRDSELYDNRRKNGVRSLALGTKQKKRKPHKRVILLPGVEMRCLDEGLENGIFTKTTRFIFIERDGTKAKKIEAGAKERGLRHYFLHHDEIYSLQRDMILSELGGPVSFAFLDFCGELKSRDFEWGILQLAKVFEKGADVSFTFALSRPCYRNNLLLPEIYKEGLFHCVPDGYTAAFEKRIAKSKWEEDYQATIAGVWAMLCLHYGVEMLHVKQYTSHKTPMVLVKTRITGLKPTVERKHILPVLDRANGNVVRLSPRQLPESAPDWQRIQCPTAMSASLKRKYVMVAKRGGKNSRPPWMLPQQWAHHSLNPNGIRKVA